MLNDLKKIANKYYENLKKNDIITIATELHCDNILLKQRVDELTEQIKLYDKVIYRLEDKKND